MGKKTTNFRKYLTIREIANTMVITSIAGLVVALVGAGITFFQQTSTQLSSLELSQRIELVSNSLGFSADELASIQSELEARIQFVNDLQVQAETAEIILNLSENEVNAVKTLLKDELDKGRAGNFWMSFAQNAVFFILGVLASYFIPKWIRRKPENAQTTTPTA